MASGGDKVKRGFAFYLFTLIAILFVAFLVVVMIMLFSPGKPILGFMYFNYNMEGQEEINHTQTTDNSHKDINFDSIDKVVVNSDYARVMFTKSTQEGSKDCVKIVNSAKGFVKASENVEFDYSVLLSSEEGKQVLTVNIKEPQAFLFFSRNVYINVCVGKTNTENLKETEVVVNTRAGGVVIGNPTDPKTSANLNISNLTVTTDSGSIEITDENGTNDSSYTLNSLFLTTNTGSVKINKTIIATSDLKFTILSTGIINVGKLTAQTSTGVQLVVNNGTFTSGIVYADVHVANLINGTVNIEGVEYNGMNQASFDTNGAKKMMNMANIKLGYARNISIPFGNNANITIGSFTETAIIKTIAGSITVNERVGNTFDFETQSGSVNLTIGNGGSTTTKYNRYINSITGNIKLIFTDRVNDLNYVRTMANVEIVLPLNSHFLLNLNTYDETPIKSLGGRVNVPFVSNDIYTYPFKVNDNGDSALYQNNQLSIFANGNIYVHLTDK